MLLYFKIKNYKTFKDEIEMSLIADMHIKRFITNTNNVNNQNILKVLSVYGPNNSGKSCLIEAIYSLRTVMLNEPNFEFFNSFYDNYITEFEVMYETNGNFYRYIVHYNSLNKEYNYEKLDKVIINKYDAFTYEKIFVRNKDKVDISLLSQTKIPLTFLNNNYPLFMLFTLKGTKLEQYQNDYIDFAKSIKMLNMELPLSINKTIELMQKDEKAKRFIVSFAKNCDLDIEDFGYSEDVKSDINVNKELVRFLESNESNKQMLKIWSKHHNHIVPSVLFDSIGTKKLIAIAGYIYESITKGGVLVIDELDSSLHHVIMRAIIALFNNLLNKKAQLIFSTNDILTMDLRHLFRKDQIYLTDIDNNGNNILIHLSEKFKARDENGIRGNEDIVDYYLKGRFGAIPNPDLFSSLLEILNEE